MPQVRAALRRTLADRPPRARLPGMPTPVWTPSIAALRAQLYWVSDEMAQVAVAAARTLPPDTQIEPPATAGLLLWDRYVEEPLLAGVKPVQGALWWVEDGTVWGCYLSDLYPLDVSPPVQLQNPQGRAPSPTAWVLAATWALMMQPIATTRITRARQSSGAAARGALPPQPVSIIALRPTTPTPSEQSALSEAHAHHVRWVVRGHWRQQPVGEGRAQRRLTWVTPHIKGPPEAPLRAERVHVWRR